MFYSVQCIFTMQFTHIPISNIQNRRYSSDGIIKWLITQLPNILKENARQGSRYKASSTDGDVISCVGAVRGDVISSPSEHLNIIYPSLKRTGDIYVREQWDFYPASERCQAICAPSVQCTLETFTPQLKEAERSYLSLFTNNNKYRIFLNRHHRPEVPVERGSWKRAKRLKNTTCKDHPVNKTELIERLFRFQESG